MRMVMMPTLDKPETEALALTNLSAGVLPCEILHHITESALFVNSLLMTVEQRTGLPELW